MIEEILQIDRNLFYFININLSNPITEIIMPILTHIIFWIPIFGIFCLFQIWNAFKYKQYRGLFCILGVLVSIVICDQISSALIKELVSRPRPCHTLTDINLFVNCGAGKSFPSSHAANSMVAVIIILLHYRKHKYWLLLLSLLVGVSRIFVGVHYPLDVLCGWLLGIGIGFSVYFFMGYLNRVYKKRKSDSKN
ncbi:MAG: phosphatase PAP2 family protein [Bacteroidetes bacterium]|nr:phosphatase PAP2 family protein [Bacteroidota bacterium]